LISTLDRARGALLGLACGDAIGTTVEFMPRGTFPPLTDLVGGGPFRLEPGQWTDDTSMALCLAESLIACGRFDAADQMRRYVRWYREGHMSPTGRCFDIGTTVRRALHAFETTNDPFSGPTDPWSAGNGSIMRLAPVVLAFFPDAERVRHFAGESSRTTHGAPEAVAACRILAAILASVLRGEAKERAIHAADSSLGVSPRLEGIIVGTYRSLTDEEIRGTGHAVASLEAALWSFWHSSSFEEAVLRAANLGDDADTTAAVCGQLAGAFWGRGAIPGRWLDRLSMAGDIERCADQLIQGTFSGPSE
jgi:ADP-ribosyl-[dinitrogen reductase] hydrolase